MKKLPLFIPALMMFIAFGCYDIFPLDEAQEIADGSPSPDDTDSNTGTSEVVEKPFTAEHERGRIRCGFEEEVDEQGNPLDHRCDVLSQEEGWCCSPLNPADAFCTTDQACQEEQSKPGIVWRAECDEPSDCFIKYPNAGIDDFVCCESFKSGNRWSLCKSKEECPYLPNDQNEGCLVTWHCPEDFTCLESIFVGNVYYCQ